MNTVFLFIIHDDMVLRTDLRMSYSMVQKQTKSERNTLLLRFLFGQPMINVKMST